MIVPPLVSDPAAPRSGKYRISAGRQYRLAVLNAHPVQYFGPLYRRLAQEPAIDLTVYYCSREGVEEYTDREFGTRLKWDVPLLDGYTYRFLPNLRRGPVGGFLSLINPGIAREIIRERYDALWLHSYTYLTYWIALAVARLCQVPVLYRTESSLTYDARLKRPLHVRVLKPLVLRFLFSRISRFLSIGTLNTQFYLHYGVPENKIFHVPYTVDNVYFARRIEALKPQRDQLRRRLGISSAEVVFLFAAKMTAQKAPLELLRAYEQVRQPGKALIMAGDGPLRQQAEAYAASRNLAGVHFVGFVNQSQLPEFYAISDVFVRPDGLYKGDWGLTVNEAMASGLAIITTDCIGAVVDLVRDGENGFVVKYGDVSQLSAAIDRIVAEPESCRQMGRRSLEIISTWTYEECVAGVKQALTSLEGTGT